MPSKTGDLQVVMYLGLRAVPDLLVPVEPIRALFIDVPGNKHEDAKKVAELVQKVVDHLRLVCLLAVKPSVQVEVYDDVHNTWSPRREVK